MGRVFAQIEGVLRIAIVGDSAGGGLALVLLSVAHADAFALAPAAAVVMSPRYRSRNCDGPPYGAPATKRTYDASLFGYVRLDDKLIVERVQQADVLGQMRQLYGKAMGLVGLGAMLWQL